MTRTRTRSSFLLTLMIVGFGSVALDSPEIPTATDENRETATP